jgi:hypothetical protein
MIANSVHRFAGRLGILCTVIAILTAVARSAGDGRPVDRGHDRLERRRDDVRVDADAPQDPVADGALHIGSRARVATGGERVLFADSRQTSGCRVGRTGVYWDNAAAESFFASPRNEMYHRYTFATRTRARFAAADYIEVFYNRRRLHFTLGYRTPFEALTDYRTAAIAA